MNHAKDLVLSPEANPVNAIHAAVQGRFVCNKGFSQYNKLAPTVVGKEQLLTTLVVIAAVKAEWKKRRYSLLKSLPA